MTVRITRNRVEYWFTLGIPRASVSLSDVTNVSQTSVPIYRGYGIRTNGTDIIWRIRGTEAVALTTRDGRRILLGTSDAGHLLSALE